MDIEPDRQKVRRVLAGLKPGTGLESTIIAQRAGIPLRRARRELTFLYREGAIERTALYVSHYGHTWLYGKQRDPPQEIFPS